MCGHALQVLVVGKILWVTAEQASDRARLARLAVAVHEAQCLPIEVLPTLCGEYSVQRRCWCLRLSHQPACQQQQGCQPTG